MGLRLSITFVKGIFIFILAKNISNIEFGMYVVLTANIAIFQYFAAGDYSYVMHRHYFSGKFKFKNILSNQSIVLILLFIICIPIYIFILPSNFTYVALVLSCLLLILETVTSEIHRHLIALSKFTSAILVLFLKSVGWMLPLMIIYLNTDINFIFIEILNVWIIGLLMSLIFGIWMLREHIKISSTFDKSILTLYIKSIGIVLIGTLLARSLFSVDRIIVEKFVGLSEVAIYGIFVGIAAAYVSIVDAGILARSYPELVKKSKQDSSSFHKLTISVFTKILFITVLTLIIYILTINHILIYIGYSEYKSMTNIGIYLILAYCIYSLSFPLNCKFYAMNSDFLITSFNFISLLPLSLIFFKEQIDLNFISILLMLCSLMHFSIRLTVLKFKNFNFQ